MSKVLVHKAVEPDNLSVGGKKRFTSLVESLVQGYGDDAWVQPKYDGVYAQFIFSDGPGWQAFSRTGQLLKSVGEGIMDAFYTKALAERQYMGELWLQGQTHQVINGRSRKQSPQYLELKLFDSIQPDYDEEYHERYDYLFDGGDVAVTPNLPMAGKVFVIDDLYDQALALRNRGSSAYDGLILRDPHGLFVPGRGTNGETIKVKPRASSSFRVVGTTKGQGNRKGGIGALIVDLGAGLHNEVGTGLSAAQVMEDPKLVVGRIAEVEYLGVTPDGKLREPSFKVYRNDVTEPDVLDHTRETED